MRIVATLPSERPRHSDRWAVTDRCGAPKGTSPTPAAAALMATNFRLLMPDAIGVS